ncbi:LOW QUALITY PROTEIN: melanoregulin, partial [Gadus morhua]|uniref:LOW QUALITY PROTEIN: melanoregulin n=1 Tax=Gadus morhua TaxID=8049 RepID=UPI0011B4FE92
GPSPDPFQGREPRPDPTASSCSRRESDTELQAFLDLRDQTDSNTEEWEKINYDIHSIRCTRREVCTRWKKILLQLGQTFDLYSRLNSSLPVRVESLLGMNSRETGRQSLPRAEELLQHLRDHSALFPPGGGPQNRYLHVMDCLVSLDSAEDFIRLATEKYPKTEISL